MSPITAVVVGSATFAMARSRGMAASPGWAAIVTLMIVKPLVGVSCGIAAAAWLRRARLVAARGLKTAAEGERILFVHALLIALSGGLGLATAMSSARGQLKSTLGDEVERVLRQSAVMGLGPALLAASGAGSRLFRHLGTAHTSGAPVVVALSSYAHELHEVRRAHALQRARQLPVKMVIPLTLMMLPGFLLLAVGPTVVSSFARLLGPFGGP